ncbi:MAG: hypothetical protein K2K46_08445 [Lachnospiraceae bacterium]|nr:hypothetical protein [Lachnospiraceae bacterium]
MKKRMVKMCIFILTLLSAMIVTGCGEIFMYGGNQRPDDDISKAIYKAVGRKKVYYEGKHINPGEIARYEYTVHDYKDEKVLTNMVEAINAVLEEKEMTEKICLTIREEMGGGQGTEWVASLRNYYESEDGYETYESLQILYIRGTKSSQKGDSSPYNKASTYINLPDIKSLVVSEKIAQNAEEEGIDWYEIWADLEYYEFLDD